MARRGPKPTPTALKLLRGNPGKRPINVDEPQPRPVESPGASPWLDETAAALWRTLRRRFIGSGC